MQQQVGKLVTEQSAGLNAERHVAGEVGFGREQWCDDAVPDELLMHGIGLDMFGEELSRAGLAPQIGASPGPVGLNWAKRLALR